MATGHGKGQDQANRRFALRGQDKQPRGLTYALLEPYLNIPVVIVTRTDAAYIGGLDDLYGKTVAVIRNYQLHERLPRDHPDITVKVVPSAEEALRCVSNGEAYAFAGNLATTSYLISKLRITPT
jgi:ABC-type amino acid transport substrate-binding protein